MHKIIGSNFGNIGNRMMQYMFACQLSRTIGDAQLFDFDLKDWNISIAASLDADETPSDHKISLDDATPVDFGMLRILGFRKQGLTINLNGYFQSLDFFPAIEEARALFQTNIVPIEQFDENDLVINIRLGDITSGNVQWYPVLPVWFYQHIISASGLNPVFVGQLDHKEYVEQLRAAFPDARYIASKGAIYDFELIRSAPNICIAVSTFSWLAAWLSNARQIFYPLVSFFNPALQSCFDLPMRTNLAPVSDPRYRFYAMPFYYAEPMQQLIEHHARIEGQAREVSAHSVEYLRDHAPFNKPRDLNSYFETALDNKWYVKTYLDAAWEIALGWYGSPAQHYFEIGQTRGYRPNALPPYQPRETLISLGKPALQSSISSWSHGASIEEDAAFVVDGLRVRDYANHTDTEDSPWWRVDLGAVHRIEMVSIFNREDSGKITDRLFPFSLEFSIDDVEFETIYRSDDEETKLYRVDRDNRSISLVCKEDLSARIVRLRLLGPQRPLHIRQVEVFGAPDNATG